MKENFIAGVVQLDPREDYEENLQSAENGLRQVQNGGQNS